MVTMYEIIGNRTIWFVFWLGSAFCPRLAIQTAVFSDCTRFYRLPMSCHKTFMLAFVLSALFCLGSCSRYEVRVKKKSLAFIICTADL